METAWNTRAMGAAMGSRPQPAPILTNTDGDILVPTADHFEITPGKASEIVRLMARFDGAEAEPPEGGESVFVVTRPGNARMKSWDNTIIGRVVVRGSRMIVESNSAQRADDLRGRLEVRLRGLVKHRLRDESSVEAMLEQAREAAARGIVTQPPDVPPELRAMARQVKEAHMRDWVNEQIPALGGLTPREAARAPRSRADLELLLRDLEFREAQLPAEERFDMRQLRATLGLKE